MKLHEYQAKKLFNDYGMPVPAHFAVTTPEQACEVAQALDADQFVVKAQVHAGGRGKSGGVRLVDTPREAADYARLILGTRLVTSQTDALGQQVNTVLVEESCDIRDELYLGMVIDPSSQSVVVMSSTEGGMEIDRIAEESPQKILKITIDPGQGVLPDQARKLGLSLGLNGRLLEQYTQILLNLGRLFFENDALLAEVNPLVVTGQGELVCLDGKINIDPSALYRHDELEQLRDNSQLNSSELKAAQAGLNYVALPGRIACLVNGAGLAMATMDIIKLKGGEPANFLDVGSSVTKEKVAEAVDIVLSDPDVKGILVNVFGGLVRGDHVALGIIASITKSQINVPVVVRLEGNMASEGRSMLHNSGLDVLMHTDLAAAAEAIVERVSIIR